MSKVAFSNGVFDVLHIGHIRLLQFCRQVAEGGEVIIGLNSDASVRRLKGPSRPINTQEHRREMLLALRCVDDVMVFDEDTPYELIKRVQPDIIVKGSEYVLQSVVGADLCSDVRLFPHVDGYSTTETIERSRSR